MPNPSKLGGIRNNMRRFTSEGLGVFKLIGIRMPDLLAKYLKLLVLTWTCCVSKLRDLIETAKI